MHVDVFAILFIFYSSVSLIQIEAKCAKMIFGAREHICTGDANVGLYNDPVQSALSDLLTTSATHGTFFRPSTKRGLILIGFELNINAREFLNIADHIH